MSGGVDSSVAAALLEKQGFDVMGVFMRFWSETPAEGVADRWNRCCSPEAEERARQVARILGIPFYVFDFRKDFKKSVVDYFIKEYKAGRTPNPCVVCNKEIKFGLLLKRAFATEVDFIATGHYVRAERGKIFRGKDKEKDQSYFLWQLNKEQLKRIIFPLGNYTKTEVRQMAKKFKLPVASIPESQEVCFVQTDLADFLKKHIKQKPGNIVDAAGRVLGRHKGLVAYTIGQRRGLELPQGPYWVLRKDLRRNVLIVTKNEQDLLQKELFFEKANWLSAPTKFPFRAEAKIRYRSKSAPVLIQKENRVVFHKLQRAITPGQSVVFYSSAGQLIGGAIIKNNERE